MRAVCDLPEEDLVEALDVGEITPALGRLAARQLVVRRQSEEMTSRPAGPGPAEAAQLRRAQYEMGAAVLDALAGMSEPALERLASESEASVMESKPLTCSPEEARLLTEQIRHGQIELAELYFEPAAKPPADFFVIDLDRGRR